MKNKIALLKKYSRENYADLMREPKETLKYPFIVPGSSYQHSLWDWDSWLTNVAVRQIMADNQDNGSSFSQCEKGCVLNFLENMLPDGRMHICISSNAKPLPDFTDGEITNIHKPIMAQRIAFILQQTNNDTSWIAPHIDKVKTFIGYYLNNCFHAPTGLFFWHDDLAIGADNEPSTYYRPKNSTAAIYLNCLMYKELNAMAYILDVLGENGEEYAAMAQRLKDAINLHMWDERNGFYYSADINLLPVDKTKWLHSGMPRHWECLLLKTDVWTGFMTMWAGIAPPERAERMVKENLLNARLFYGEYGIRSLAKTEPMYKVVKSGNPSCWLGPVWGIVQYMCFRGLLNYGYEQIAKDLAEKIICLYGASLEEYGALFEYYDPDTGAGVNNLGFQSWNLLINNMIAWYEGKNAITEF